MYDTASWTVEPLIGLGHNALIYGQQGSGKSWLAWFVAKAVSEGVPLLGKFNTNKGRCIIYDEETPMTDLEVRRKLVFGNQPEASIEANIYDLPSGSSRAEYLKELVTRGTDIVLFPQGTFSLGMRKAGKRLADDIELFDADLVILDNLNSMQGNLKIEKDSCAVAKVRDIFKEVRQIKPNMTIIIIHHEGKVRTGTPRGSSAIVDMSDTVIRLEGLQVNPLQFLVQPCSTRKRPAYQKPFLVQLTGGDSQLDLTYVEEVAEGDVELPTDDAVDIAAYLMLLPDEQHTVKSITEATKGRFSERTVREELRNLEVNGFLEVGRLSHNQFQYRLVGCTDCATLYGKALQKKLAAKGIAELRTKSEAEGMGFPLDGFIFLRGIAKTG